jgi:hypothetical protein
MGRRSKNGKDTDGKGNTPDIPSSKVVSSITEKISKVSLGSVGTKSRPPPPALMKAGGWHGPSSDIPSARRYTRKVIG